MAERLITLCGFSGSGKTTVGRLLSTHLKYPFVDLDVEIERQEGRTIERIFETDGESYFRAMEVLIGTPLFETAPQVLALGGGALTNPELAQLVSKKSFLVYLEITDAWTLYDRLKGDTKRPLLKEAESYETFEGVYRRLMSRRRPAFERAQLTIQTDPLLPEQIVERILGRVQGASRHGRS